MAFWKRLWKKYNVTLTLHVTLAERNVTLIRYIGFRYLRSCYRSEKMMPPSPIQFPVRTSSEEAYQCIFRWFFRRGKCLILTLQFGVNVTIVTLIWYVRFRDNKNTLRADSAAKRAGTCWYGSYASSHRSTPKNQFVLWSKSLTLHLNN